MTKGSESSKTHEALMRPDVPTQCFHKPPLPATFVKTHIFQNRDAVLENPSKDPNLLNDASEALRWQIVI